MLAWWLLVIVAGLNGAGLVGSLWFIYHYCHPDDLRYNQGILAQVVAILGFQIFYLAFTLVCYDSYNVVFNGGFAMTYFWKLIYLGICIYLSVILPVAVFYYQADSDRRIAKRSPTIQTARNTGICIVAVWGLIGLLYVMSRTVEMPCEQAPSGCESGQAVLKHVDFLTFLIGLPGYVGWYVLMIVGGIGTAAVPINLFYKWLYRPKPLSPFEYEELKKMLGQRATALREVGETLRLVESSGEGGVFSMKKPTHSVKFKQRVSRFKEVSNLLADEYQRMNERRASTFRSPLKTMSLFILAMLSLLSSLILIIQSMITIMVPAISKKDPTSGIGALMTLVQKSHLMLPEFAIYLFVYGHQVFCAVYGLIRLNAKLNGCLPVEALRPQLTHLNALLFHTAVMMLCGCAVITLSVSTLPSFVAGTEAEKIAVAQKNYIRIHKVMYRNSVFEWIWFIVVILSAIWLSIWPSNKPPIDVNDPKVLARWAKLNAKLGVDAAAPGGLMPLEQNPTPPTEPPPEPNAFDRLKNKMQRFDQGVADAPGAIMGAAITKPW